VQEMALKRRVNIHMDMTVYEKVKQYSENYGISVSAAITLLTKQSLEQAEAFSSLPEIMKAVKQLNATAAAGSPDGN